MSKKKKRIKQDHTNCNCLILQRGPHWGLFCAEHDAYIKWLSAGELAVVRTMDIGMISQAQPKTIAF